MFVFKRALGQEIFSVLPFVEQKNEQEGLDIVETSFVFSFTSLHDWWWNARSFLAERGGGEEGKGRSNVEREKE